MTPDYWLERWREGRTGFHLAETNPRLVEHHAGISACQRVLVPLCGKSADLAWLAMQGHEVLGVELSELAASAFFSERGMTPESRQRGELVELSYGSVAILVGDIFALDQATLGDCDGAYDRAAMIALPSELRERYVRKLRSLLQPKARLLLLTLDFDAEGGPPFAVSAEEVVRAYSGARLQQLDSRDARGDAPGPLERGASFVHEETFLIQL